MKTVVTTVAGRRRPASRHQRQAGEQPDDERKQHVDIRDGRERQEIVAGVVPRARRGDAEVVGFKGDEEDREPDPGPKDASDRVGGVSGHLSRGDRRRETWHLFCNAMVTRRSWAVTIGLLCLVACRQSRPAPDPAAAVLVERTHRTMGTEMKVSAWTTDDVGRGGVRSGLRRIRSARRADERLAGRERYRAPERRGRRASCRRQPRRSRECCGIARQVSEWTDGKFDVTFGALRHSGSSTTRTKTTPFPIDKRC